MHQADTYVENIARFPSNFRVPLLILASSLLRFRYHWDYVSEVCTSKSSSPYGIHISMATVFRRDKMPSIFLVHSFESKFWRIQDSREGRRGKLKLRMNRTIGEVP